MRLESLPHLQELSLMKKRANYKMNLSEFINATGPWEFRSQHAKPGEFMPGDGVLTTTTIPKALLLAIGHGYEVRLKPIQEPTS